MTLFELVASLSLNVADFTKGVGDAENEGKTLAQKLGADADSIKSAFSGAFSVSIGQLMADGFKAALGAAWDFAEGSIEAASNLEEIQNVVDTIFGDKAGAFDAWAKNALDNFGMGEMAAKSYATTIASVLEPETRGFNADEVYEMSIALTQLVGDIASFRNMDFDTVFTMIMSGLRGETESIEQLGIDMRIASLAAFAGLEKASDFSQLSDYEQTMFRYQYIMSATSRAQGDFQRTQGSYANQTRTLEENIANLQAALGEKLLPTMTSLVTIMNDLFFGEESAADGIEAVKDAYSDNMATVATTATNALALVDALEELSAASEDAASTETWQAILAELEQTIPGIGDLIDDQTGKISGGTAALREYINNWRELAMVTAQQKAVQDLMDEYSALEAKRLQLQWEQESAARYESANLKNMQTYEREFATGFEAALRAAGFSDAQIAAKYAENWALGAADLFGLVAGGTFTTEEALKAQYLMPTGAKMSLGDLWTLGGGTQEELIGLISGWTAFQQEYLKYRDVDNTAEIAELEATIATQAAQLEYVQSMMSLQYGLLWGTPEATASEETGERETHWSRFVEEELVYLEKLEGDMQTFLEAAKLGYSTKEDISYADDYLSKAKTSARIAATDDADEILARIQALYDQAVPYLRESEQDIEDEESYEETETQEEKQEDATAAEEALTAANQIAADATEATESSTAANSLLISVLQGLPANIASALSGISIVLDTGAIVGAVSAGIAREARGNRYTGGSTTA